MGDDYPAYQAAEARAIEHLREYAVEGQREAAYVLDRTTGEVLDFVEGEPDKVFIAAPEGVTVVALHCHTTVTPPGPVDWNTFLLAPLVPKMIVVDPRYQYTVAKPEGWHLPPLQGTGRITAYSYFMAHAHPVRREMGIKSRQWAIAKDALETILHETNARMAQQFELNYRREAWP